MPVTDQMLLIAIVMLINYAFLWSKGWFQRIIADILFIVIGFGTHYVVSVTEYPWGLFIIIIAAIDLLYTAINP